MLQGALVQLVRIHACHAWGHGFESRTHRQLIGTLTEWLGSGLQNRVQQFESAGYLKANVISNVRFFCARMNWLVLWLIGKVTVFILMLQGALVQLVRIHACHAWGHGFESRTHRQLIGTLTEWLGSGLQNRVQQFESAGYLKASIVSMFAFLFVSSISALFYMVLRNYKAQ